MGIWVIRGDEGVVYCHNTQPLVCISSQLDEQHRYMGLNSHGVSKVSVIDTAGVKQVEHK